MVVGSLFFALASLVLLWSVYSMVSISTHTRTYTGQFLYPELYSGTSGTCTSTHATLCISGLRHFSHLIVCSCVSLDTTTVPLPSPRKFFPMSPIRLCRRHCLLIFLLLLQGNVGSLGSRRPVSLLLSLLLLSSGDVELNPGPARNWKYPCGVCSKPVRPDQKGVQCDLCSTWLHARKHWLVSPRLLRATVLWWCLVLQQVHPGSYALWWCFQLWLCVPRPIQQLFKLHLQLNHQQPSNYE